jgi:hypothetical protein
LLREQDGLFDKHGFGQDGHGCFNPQPSGGFLRSCASDQLFAVR